MQTERLILTVSALNAEVNQLLTQGFPALWVEGEISNFTRATSGHLYLTLKDADAQIRCAMFKGRALLLRFNPRNGLKVIVKGKIGLYEARGDYQLVIDGMEAAGEGNLQRQFEQLKQQLYAQGLFALEHKQPLPFFPRAIGVITSPTGAAVRDILNVLKRRCPQIPVFIYPVAVQGEEAQGQIVHALQQAERDQYCDVLILARGGGSLEDLWAFNEASIAQAIYACSVPIISGVGHEIDFTIADFVADVRAPTPSAAAELVSPDLAALQQLVQRLHTQLIRLQLKQLQLAKQQVMRLQQRLTQQRPTQRLQQKAQRLDELEARLGAAINRQLQHRVLHLHNLQSRLNQQAPSKIIAQYQFQLKGLHQRLSIAINQALKHARSRLQLQANQLHTLSPLATLDRGYSLTRANTNGEVIRTSQQVQIGQSITTQVAQGSFTSVINYIYPALKLDNSD